MKIKDIKSEGLSHELEITIPANDIDKKVEERLAEVSKTIKIPGFRPGKVPMPMMKQRYGKSVMGEVLEKAVNETSAKAMADRGLKPAMQPKIEVKSFDDGKDLVYSMNVEVLPEIKIGDYKNLKLEKLVAKPSESDKKEALERVAKNNRKTQAIKTKRASKEGDVVIIDFDGRTAHDNKHHEGMKAQDYRLELGSGSFIKGYEEQLTGKKIGDKVEVKVTFPEHYGAPELAGQDAIFDVEIKGIEEYTDVEIDDEFAKSLGMDDKAALEKAIEEQIQREFDNYTRMKLKKALLDQLDEQHQFDVPQGMLDMEFQAIERQVQQERQNENPSEPYKMPESEKEELKEIAARRVRLGLVLSEIGQEAKVQIADADLQRAVIAEAQKYPGQEKEVFDYYAKNKQALDSLRAPLFEEKVVDYILELADVKEKTVSSEELTADDDLDELTQKKAKKSGSKKSTDKKPAAKKDEKKPAAKKKAPPKSKK